ncbi:50S ribosomal protein L23 [Candidatus Nomurabacteria bacterium]|nr:50S ribosomal protein L23 [Candidatus Nomurabacteria bacterium]
MTTKMKLIKKPRVTEKASFMAEKHNVYTFNVEANANKTEIKKEIFALYKVKPLKVNITTVKAKEIIVKGRKGVKQGGKKASVYLKKGDKIEII